MKKEFSYQIEIGDLKISINEDKKSNDLRRTEKLRLRSLDPPEERDSCENVPKYRNKSNRKGKRVINQPLIKREHEIQRNIRIENNLKRKSPMIERAKKLFTNRERNLKQKQSYDLNRQNKLKTTRNRRSKGKLPNKEHKKNHNKKGDKAEYSGGWEVWEDVVKQKEIEKELHDIPKFLKNMKL
jgi:hypothetical protein